MAKRDLILAAHAERGVFGASDVAAIAGLSAWGTPLKVYLRQVLPPEERTEEKDEEWQYWGWDLEPNILRRTADATGCPILGLDWGDEPALFWPGERYPFGRDDPRYQAVVVGGPYEELVTETVRHPSLPLITHPDGILFETKDVAKGNWHPSRVINAKTASAWKKGEWGDGAEDRTVPIDYVIQNHAEMLVVEAALAEAGTPARLDGGIPVLIGGQEFRWFPLDRDERFHREIPELIEEMARRVREEDPPPAEPTAKGLADLKEMYPAEDPERAPIVAEMGSKAGDAALRLREAMVVHSEAKTELDAAKVEVQQLMGDAPALVGPGVRVSWRKAKDRRETNWKAVAADLRNTVAEETWDDVTETNTKTKAGTRSFKPTLQTIEED